MQTESERRNRKFQQQFGICYWFSDGQRNGYKSKCPDTLGRMTLERGPGGKVPANYATFEHLQRRRDGGAGKPFNVVLACRRCNSGRDAGVQLEKPKPANAAARRMTNAELVDGLRAGMLDAAARGELYARGVFPNWPMWSKIMACEPLVPF